LAPAAASAPAADEAARLLAQIEARIGVPRCTQEAQCRSLALGQRPCGGPEAYRAHALQGPALDELQALAARHAALRRDAHRQSRRVGICQLLPDPGASCTPAGVCALREAR